MRFYVSYATKQSVAPPPPYLSLRRFRAPPCSLLYFRPRMFLLDRENAWTETSNCSRIFYSSKPVDNRFDELILWADFRFSIDLPGNETIIPFADRQFFSWLWTMFASTFVQDSRFDIRLLSIAHRRFHSKTDFRRFEFRAMSSYADRPPLGAALPPLSSLLSNDVAVSTYLGYNLIAYWEWTVGRLFPRILRNCWHFISSRLETSLKKTDDIITVKLQS